MSSVSAIAQGADMSPSELEAAYQTAVIRKQKEVLEDQGELALKLIQSASVVDPDIGRNLNVQL